MVKKAQAKPNSIVSSTDTTVPESWVCLDYLQGLHGEQQVANVAGFTEEHPLKEADAAETADSEVEQFDVDTVLELDDDGEETVTPNHALVGDVQVAAYATLANHGSTPLSEKQNVVIQTSNTINDQVSGTAAAVLPNGCPLECGETINSENQLRRHLQEKHALTMKKEVSQFPSMGSFLAWKEARERESCRRYVVRETRSNWRRFACTRSGHPTGTGRPQRWKKSGSYCSAYIRTKTAPDGSVKARYCLMHTCQLPDNSTLGSEREIAKAHRHLDLLERALQSHTTRVGAPLPRNVVGNGRTPGGNLTKETEEVWRGGCTVAGERLLDGDSTLNRRVPWDGESVDIKRNPSSEGEPTARKRQLASEDTPVAEIMDEQFVNEEQLFSCHQPSLVADTCAVEATEPSPRRKRPRSSRARKARSAARAWRSRATPADHVSSADLEPDAAATLLKTRAKTNLMRLLSMLERATRRETQLLLADTEELLTKHDTLRRRGTTGRLNQQCHTGAKVPNSAGGHQSSLYHLGRFEHQHSSDHTSEDDPTSADPNITGYICDTLQDHAYIHGCHQRPESAARTTGFRQRQGGVSVIENGTANNSSIIINDQDGDIPETQVVILAAGPAEVNWMGNVAEMAASLPEEGVLFGIGEDGVLVRDSAVD